MARRGKKIAGITLLVIVALLLVGITFTIGWRPFIGPRTRVLTNRTFEATAARLERGRYTVNAVYGCLACHSPRDQNSPGMPPLADKLGAGAVFGEGAELPGKIIAPNLTPDKETGAGNWTDDMLARAIREGIGNDGRALFPLMPYLNYQAMPDEELASVIVYLRSLAPVRNPLPQSELISPVKYLIRSAMPWSFYRNMTDEDLRAIYAYIRTFKPVKHAVDNTELATACKLCGINHGGGERN